MTQNIATNDHPKTNSLIPEGWQEVKLGDVVEIKHGYAFKGEFITDIENQNILLTPGNFEIGGGWKYGKKYYIGEIPSNYILSNNDLVVTMTDLSKSGDTLGYPALIPNNNQKKFLHNQRIGLVKLKNNSDKNYINYLLKWSEYQKFIVNSSTGSTVRHTSPTKIYEFCYNTPIQVTEQKAIASILSCLDDKIELLRDQNKTLEDLGQKLFQRELAENGDDCGEWKLGELYNIFDSKRKPVSSDIRKLRKGIYPYHGATSVMGYIDDYIFDGVYLLMGEDGSVMNKDGFPFLQYVEGKIWVNNHAHVLQGKGKFTTEFLYLLLSRTGVSNIVTGGVQPKINQSNLQNLIVRIPNEKSVDKITDLVSNIFSKILANTQQIQTLSRTRDTILPVLMTGKVRV